MPSEDIRITRSAGINFGVPNSEYRFRIDPVTGEALSCYNQDTDTEYIGGGGGDSDFSTAVVKIYNPEELEVSIVLPEINSRFDAIACFAMSVTDDYGVEVVLYHGSCMINWNESGYTIETTGGIEYDPQGGVIITGDGTITFARETA